jgi:hypothetical protein
MSFTIIFDIGSPPNVLCLSALKYPVQATAAERRGLLRRGTCPPSTWLYDEVLSFGIRLELSRGHLTPSSTLSLRLQPSHAFFAVSINNVVSPTASPFAAAIIGIVPTAL